MSFDPHALRLTERVRRLIERLVTVDASDDDLRAADEAVDALLRRFDGLPDRPRWYHSEAVAERGFFGYLEHSPLVGVLHPLAPPLTLERSGDRIRGRVTFGTAYEGPPGCVHGGYVAAIMDELLGAAQAVTGAPGYTGTLTVRFTSPTPLREELVLDGGVDKVEGRKIFTSGTCHAGARLCAEAEALFVSLDITDPKFE